MRRSAIVAATMLFVLAGGAAHAVAAEPEGIHKIQHVVMIMQENRSYDSYFGTYPGANGIPANTCVPDPAKGGCIKPFHDGNDRGPGGPHGTESAEGDIDNGRMDGFVSQVEKAEKCTSTKPTCLGCTAEQKEAKKAATT